MVRIVDLQEVTNLQIDSQDYFVISNLNSTSGTYGTARISANEFFQYVNAGPGNVSPEEFNTAISNINTTISNLTTDDVAEESNLYFTTARARSSISATGSISYNSSTGVISYTQPTNVSTFTNDAGYVTAADGLDSAEAIALINAAYVQARQDYQYSSLTGAPTNVSTFNNDAGYLTDADTLDSAEAIALIDSAYVQARQDYQYSSLTGAPTNVSTFTNDAGYLTAADSTAVVAGVNVYSDSTYLPLVGNNAGDLAFATDNNGLYIWAATAWQVTKARTTDELLEGSVKLYYTDERVDDRVDKLIVGGNNITATYNDAAGTLTIDGQPGYADSDVAAYLYGNLDTSIIPDTNATYDIGTASYKIRDLYLSDNSLHIGENTLSTNVSKLLFNGEDVMDYANITSKPTTLAGYGITDGYVTAADGLDSAEAIALIDSAYVQARQDYQYSSLTGVPTNVSTFNNDAGYVTAADGLDSAEAIALIDSAYVQARVGEVGIDSDAIISLIDSAYVQARQLTYDFLDSAEAIALIDSAYVQARANEVYITGITDPKYISLTGDSMTGDLWVDGSIYASGNITGFASFSDITLKENVIQIESALDKVLNLTGYTFNYIGNPVRVPGLIAQEVEIQLPEAVYETPGGKKAVHYGNMMGLMVEAIKELKSEIDEIKEKLK